MRLFAPLAVLASLVCLIEGQVTISFDSYLATISVNNQVWLQTGDVWFNAQARKFSTADQSLNLTATHTAPGIDSLGRYVATTHSWASVPSGLFWETAYRVYSNDDQSSVNQIVFSQTWMNSDDQTTVKDVDSVLSSFPTFIPSKSARSLGANQWHDAFDSSTAFVWSGSNAALKLSRGRAAGPMILFDATEPNLVSVFSNFNEFMATSFANVDGQLATGIVGSMTSVPAQFYSESILSFGDRGINEGILHWGDLLLSRYGKNRLDAFVQPNTQYLGYNTDNGAYYYYHTEDGMNYEQTLEAVIDYARDSNIPYRGMLLDSWWYPKDKTGAVTSWTPMTSVFPSGLTALAEYLKMPFIAHNRYWSPDSPYATQNGGTYDWHVDGQWSMPTEQRFWDDLIANQSTWNLRVYEQDWLFTVFDNMNILQTNITFGKSWLHQMGSGAARSGVDIQYCMPYPRYVLQSVEIPNVVQVRASGDNTPGNVGNAEIGESNLLSYALGIASFKDGFWTVSDEPGNPYNNETEPSPGLHAVVATLSMGPVYPSDKIGYTNISLLARSHRADGLILKPDRPAFALDVSYYHRAFGTKGPDAAQVTLAQSNHARWNWNVLLVLEESHDYTLTTADLGIPTTDAQSYIAYSWHAGDLHYDFVPFDVKNPLPLSANPHVNDFTVWYMAPVLVPGFALLGETSKWVPMSKQRVSGFQINQQAVTLNLIGEVGEKVTIDYANLINTESGNLYDGSFAETWVASSAVCVLNNAGSATLAIALNDVNSFSCVQ